MALSPLTRRKLLLRPLLLQLAGRPLTYLDIGARGELDEPWSLMHHEALNVIGFEPDSEACATLNATAPTGWRYLPAALWSANSTVTFHINRQASTSSVFPANLDRIRRYGRRHWQERETTRTVEAPARTLDEVTATFGIDSDMIKIDTQGCELPILAGATATLDKAVAVLLETWTTEVYRGQGLTGDVLQLMRERGFSLYDVNLAAAWKRQRAYQQGLFCKPQVIGLDLLFIKDNFQALCADGRTDKAIIAAAIADMFGFPDAALDLLEEAQSIFPEKAELESAASAISDIARRSNSLGQKIRRRVLRWLGSAEIAFPSLHY